MLRRGWSLITGGLNQLKKNFVFGKAKDIITKQQERQTLEEKQSNAATVTQAIAQISISCEKHPNNELKYYCEDDDTVVCGDCASTDHYRHGIVPVDKVAKSNRDKITVALVKTMKTMNRFKEALVMETSNETEDSHIRIATIKEVKEQAESLRKLIGQREKALISEVNSAYDIRKKQKEANKYILEFHHTSLQSACDFAQELITNGTDSDVMVHAKSLTERLTVMEKTPVPTLDTPAQISYIPGEISAAGLVAMLGQLQTQPPLAGQGTYPRSAPYPPVFLAKARCEHSFSSTLKDDSAMYITGLAIDEEHVFVVDYGHDRTKMFTHTGDFKYDIKVSSPFDVAVSQTGHLYITSRGDKCVEVHTPTGQQVTAMGQGLLEDPRGITLNRQGHVMVCDSRKRSIFTFHADSGQFMNTIPLSMCTGPINIAVNSLNDKIVISDWSRHCVQVLSPSGDQLYQYGTEGSGDGQLYGPRGLCTDSNGHIFIADYYNNRIVSLSPQGQFIRYIGTKDDGLEFPVALAMNPGQLVVAETNGIVQTFQFSK